MGLAKNATETLTQLIAPITDKSEEPKSILSYGENDLPLPKRFYDYFNVNWQDDVEFDEDKRIQLNTIYNHAKTRIEKSDLSSLIVYVDGLARKLGYHTRADEKMYSNIYNYIKLSENIASMTQEKQMYERGSNELTIS